MMDFVSKLLKTSRGNDMIWMIVDWMTKSAHFLATRENKRLENLAKLYMEEIVIHNGLILSIISDRDNLFALRLWQKLQEELGTRVYFSTAHHPQTDGQSERIIKTLQDRLQSCIILWVLQVIIKICGGKN